MLASAVAVVFGVATIRAGGQVLFGDAAVRAAAGRYLPGVLWFNFTAGFAYVVAGVGLWRRRRWAGWLAIAIAAGTVAIFGLLGLHVASGLENEPPTVVAMSARSAVWCAIAWLAWRIVLRLQSR